MTFWTEIHWHEGMFLRPHHLQAAQRRMETVVRTSLDAARPYAWGFLSLEIAKEPLENFTLRLDRCDLRLKDGTWVRIPENTIVSPLNFQNAIDAAKGTVELFLGVPEMQEVRANAVPLENPDAVSGSPRYEPAAPVARRDENTGQNPQTLYVRRMRARLFVAGEDMTGYEVVRIGRLRRSDRPVALPEMDEFGVGPVLAVQADSGLSGAMNSLADQIEAKDEVLAREAKDHAMKFTDGVSNNTEHLLKLHALNEVRAQFKAMLQGPLLHPFDAFVTLSRIVGRLSVFHDDLVPGPLPAYDQDEPGVALAWLRRRIVVLLDALRPMNYVERPFARKRDERGRDGLEIELDRKWVDEDLEMFVGLTTSEMDVNEVYNHVYNKFDMKLASPSRAPKIYSLAVKGLRLQIKSVPPGSLPRRSALHYFRVDKTIGPDRTDYWKECEQERGIRLSIREGQIASMELFQPKLFVILKGPEMATETVERTNIRLTEACWPVFDFLINFTRQLKYGNVPAPDNVRYEALSALRDAEESARNEPTTERAWNDRVKAMMVYLLDYKMLNTEWDGRDYWFDNRFETDPDVLDHVEALGGEKFFEDCDEIQREYEAAERRDRKDKDELAEQLSLYFVCLRLGFKGMYHDRPQELADYTRRLFSRLPAYAATRGKELFPEAYKHNQELKVDYRLGMSLSIMLTVFLVIIIAALITFRFAWYAAVADIRKAAEDWKAKTHSAAPAPTPAPGPAPLTTQPKRTDDPFGGG